MAAEGIGVALVPVTVIGAPATSAVSRRVQGLPPREVALITRAGLSSGRAAEAVSSLVARTARDAAEAMPGCHTIERDRTTSD